MRARLVAYFRAIFCNAQPTPVSGNTIVPRGTIWDLSSEKPASRKGRCASREIVPRGTIVGPAIQASTSHGNGEIVPRGTIVLVDTLVRPDLRRITPVCTTLRASQRAGRMHRPAQFSAMWRAFLSTVVTDTLANGRGVPPDLFSRVSFNGRGGRSSGFFVLAAERTDKG